jgi:hypothetical protein
MKTKIATQDEWARIVMHAKAHASPMVAELLNRGELAYQLDEETLVRAPYAPSGALESAPMMRSFRHQVEGQPDRRPTSAKAFHEMAFKEKHDLYFADRAAYDAARDADLQFRGKAWGELTNDDLVTLYREDHERFLRMQDHAQREECLARQPRINDSDDAA